MNSDRRETADPADKITAWPAQAEYRFDRVKSDQEWAALIWECGREWVKRLENNTKNALETERMRTMGMLRAQKGFPKTPWVMLRDPKRAQLAKMFRLAPGELENYDVLVEAQSRTADEWRASLRRLGCVVFDLGVPPRDGLAKWQPVPKRYPTRAALLAKFEAWLDQNPNWWKGKGDRRRGEQLTGNLKPKDALRWLAWLRISRSARSSHQRTADGNAQNFVLRNDVFSEWLKLPTSPAKRSKRKADFEVLLKLVCKP
jgi:hypothetical protein